MKKDQILILGLYLLIFALYIWHGLVRPEAASERDDATIGHFIQFVAISIFAFVGITLNLIIGWNGLTKPKYGKELLVKEKIVYCLGIIPMGFLAISVICWSCYSAFELLI